MCWRLKRELISAKSTDQILKAGAFSVWDTGPLKFDIHFFLRFYTHFKISNRPPSSQYRRERPATSPRASRPERQRRRGSSRGEREHEGLSEAASWQPGWRVRRNSGKYKVSSVAPWGTKNVAVCGEAGMFFAFFLAFFSVTFSFPCAFFSSSFFS